MHSDALTNKKQYTFTMQHNHCVSLSRGVNENQCAACNSDTCKTMTDMAYLEDRSRQNCRGLFNRIHSILIGSLQASLLISYPVPSMLQSQLNKFHIYAPINVGIWRQCVCF